MDKRWTRIETDENIVNQLRDSLGIHPALCSILSQRGITNFDEAKTFFRPALTDLHDPWLMKDMDKAVQRISKAIDSGEKVLVFGDYDVDGTTSVACLYLFLSELISNEKIEFYIPHRYKEGYGVSRKGIDFARENGYTLILTLDCGIKSVELIRYAQSLGIDFIICDHHLPGELLPPAVAILNPKQEDCSYPYKELCGCGITYKLITALAEHFKLGEEKAHCFLDLVATAIAADIVPMTGENRVLAFWGLRRVNEKPSPGIKALIRLSGLQKELHINNLVFIIAPRVNAAGRMDDARKAVLMFIEKDENKALAYAEMLHTDNTDRKEADLSITGEALDLIRNNDRLTHSKSTVVFQPHWHKGVVGIVASRLIEHYYRPTIVLTQSGDILAGSARSIPGFNIHEGLDSCKEFLLGFGGHYYAAGMTLLPENLESFAIRFEEVVSSRIPERLLIPEIRINAEIHLSDINQTFYKILNQMEPFGPENARPVFLTRHLSDNGWSKIVKDEHLRFVLREGNIVFKGIGFGLARKYDQLKSGPVDLLYTIDENEWNGERHLQLKVVDFRPSNSA